MKGIVIAAAALLMAAPVMAQEHGQTPAHGYVTGLGGFSVSLGDSTGNTILEGGVRVVPHVMVFGNLGHYANLQSELEPTLNGATAALAGDQGLGVTATGSVPATYGLVGLRLELPMGGRVLPYLLGGIGAARLKPSAQFSYANGLMADGTTPAVGTDITSEIVTSGSFVNPLASTARMTTLGGGLQFPVAQHWVVDAGYRYSRIAADSTLSAAPLNTNGMAFGFGYRF